MTFEDLKRNDFSCLTCCYMDKSMLPSISDNELEDFYNDHICLFSDGYMFPCNYSEKGNPWIFEQRCL